MQTPKIFISHISEEKGLAEILKKEIERVFLGLPDVFVSSDGESISVGSRWLDEIDRALKDSQIILLLCSKTSVKRPWINFEAGAGWVKKIPVIPICHTDIRPVELPIPLNMLQGIEVTNKPGLSKVFELIGSHLGVKNVPEIQFDRIIKEIENFEKDYGFIGVVRNSVQFILKTEPQLEQILSTQPKGTNISGYLGDLVIDKIRPHLDTLKQLGMLDYSIGGNMMAFGQGGGGGSKTELKINVMPAFYTIASKVI